MAGGGSARAEAHQLLETDRYNKDILPQLTDCVHRQAEEGWYDLDVNLAVLKLYQFHPDPDLGVVQLDVMVKILALALMQLPAADFKLCLYLIPEQYQSSQTVDSLSRLAGKLESCQFTAFWDLLGKKPEVLALVSGIEDSLRRAIFGTVSMAYQELPVSQLCEFLHCNQDNLVKNFGSSGLSIQGDKAIMPKTTENQPKTQMIEENAQLPQLAQVLANTLF